VTLSGQFGGNLTNMRKHTDIEPVVGDISTVAKQLGWSVSTVRRRMKHDLNFPRPWRDGPKGHWRWLLEETRTYAINKAR
jgi:predicted DNA-binding transcriptional regulator AlpA